MKAAKRAAAPQRPRCGDLAPRYEHDHLRTVCRRACSGAPGRGEQEGSRRHERSGDRGALLRGREVVAAGITIGSAARFGTLKQELGSRGRVKADIDLHIAATAIEEGATLVTNDGALLLGDIDGLAAENWI